MPWDPLGDLRAWQERFERLTSRHPDAWSPAIDVYETTDRYVVTAEIPGLERDQVRLLVSDASHDSFAHRRFTDFPDFVGEGDVVVVNSSATLNAALDGTRADGEKIEVHLSQRLFDDRWAVELRRITERGTEPRGPGICHHERDAAEDRHPQARPEQPEFGQPDGARALAGLLTSGIPSLCRSRGHAGEPQPRESGCIIRAGVFPLDLIPRLGKDAPASGRP